MRSFRQRAAFAAIPVLLAAPAAGAQTVPTPAVSVPIVAVHREVGLAAEGQFLNYKENFPAAPTGEATPHDRETGGAPGFAFKAEAMGDLGPVRHAYAAVRFRYNDGTTHYAGGAQFTGTPISATDGLETEDVTVELGKGWLLTRRLLVTPVVQGGYHRWDRVLGYDEDYHHFFAGLAVHLDYALTPRLVALGRLGWAETLSPRMTAGGIEVPSGDGGTVTTDADHFRLGTRPVWQAGLSLDYRLLRHVHLTGGVDFQRFGYGEDSTTVRYRGTPIARAVEPDSWTQQVVLSTGLAWSF